MKRIIIPGFDGFCSDREILKKIQFFFNQSPLADLIYAVKLGDALYFPFWGPAILESVANIIPDEVGIFIDIKIAEVRKSIKNILERYASYKLSIVTVSSMISADSLVVVRETLPSAKIALYDTPTDMSEKECQLRFGKNPLEKILQALEGFDLLLGKDNPIDMVVCSAWEMPGILDRFGERYQLIVPGIRDSWMPMDYQKRRVGSYDALTKSQGMSFPVMSTQLFVGNPVGGILPEESQRRTRLEIEKYFNEKEYEAK